ncbi:hypothetical protein BS78_03G409700 [Paspalum vaginatum]|nr:hypothetical protein BS78_03G409700 [Paspalum vaginatum]
MPSVGTASPAPTPIAGAASSARSCSDTQRRGGVHRTRDAGRGRRRSLSRSQRQRGFQRTQGAGRGRQRPLSRPALANDERAADVGRIPSPPPTPSLPPSRRQGGIWGGRALPHTHARWSSTHSTRYCPHLRLFVLLRARCCTDPRRRAAMALSSRVRRRRASPAHPRPRH